MQQRKNLRRRWMLIAAATTLTIAAAGAAGTRLASAAAGGGTLAATAGCGRSPTLSSGTRSIQTSGKTRSYILRIPDNYRNSQPYRLIFAFHWNGGTANDVAGGGTDRDAWAYYGLMQLSNNSAVLVAPQGFNNGWANSGGEDVTFVDDMIKQIEGDLCVDTTQLFSVGFSYGGGMSYALACARATVFRAVAVYSGAQLSGCSGGTQPIAYLGIHGIGDSVLNISQGRSLRDTFVRNNGCTAQSPPEPKQGSLTHIVTAYSGCRTGYPVVWAAFDGGHTPGPVDGGGDSGARTWTKGEVWKFFSQFQSTPPASSGPPVTTPPVTSRPPASTPPVTTPPAGVCSATYTTINSWPGGFQGDVTVTAGGSRVSGWTVRWTLANGQTISQVWNGTLSVSGSSVTVTNASYNGALGANASTTFGFVGSGSPSTPTLTCTSP